jgi:hypothetical protein
MSIKLQSLPLKADFQKRRPHAMTFFDTDFDYFGQPYDVPPQLTPSPPSTTPILSAFHEDMKLRARYGDA